MPKASPILVFQHMPADHPGYLFDRLRDDGMPFDILRLDHSEPIPDLAAYSALWVLGGPMDVWQEREHPWLIPEKRAIREAVLTYRMPYFGVCLGHQLLADALGGLVGQAERPEIGIVDVRLNDEGSDHPLLDTLPRTMELLQWHLAEVQSPPPGAEILASSDNCAIHGFCLGGRVLGLQSHIEVSMASVDEWLSSESARTQLEGHLGPGAVSSFRATVEAAMAGMNRATDRLYERLMAAITR